MKNLFLKAKPSALLLLLKDTQQQWYPSKLARGAGMSYVHAVNLLSVLHKGGAVSTEKKGRQNMYKLTEKGQALASVLDDFSKKCDAAAQEQKEKLALVARSEEKPQAAQQNAPEKKQQS